jgi:hypothetical protein
LENHKNTYFGQGLKVTKIMSLAELITNLRSLNFDEYLDGRHFDERRKLILKSQFELLKIELSVVEQRFGVLFSESTPELQELFAKLNLLDSALITGASTYEEISLIFIQISTICKSISNSQFQCPGTKLYLLNSIFNSSTNVHS